MNGSIGPEDIRCDSKILSECRHLECCGVVEEEFVCSGNFVQPDAMTPSRSLWSKLGP